jgi:hypothetical protein
VKAARDEHFFSHAGIIHSKPKSHLQHGEVTRPSLKPIGYTLVLFWHADEDI